MISLKNEKGITIISLVITVIILFIISGVVAFMGTTGVKEVKDSKLNTELQMVQHAILEQYAKYKTTRNDEDLIGEPVNKEEVTQIASELGIELVNISDTNYYKLNKEALKAIGIGKANDEYIVNYISGEVINITQKRLSNQNPLYIRGNSF